MPGLSSFPGRAVFQQLVQDSVQTVGIVIALIVARVRLTGIRLTGNSDPCGLYLINQTNARKECASNRTVDDSIGRATIRGQ